MYVIVKQFKVTATADVNYVRIQMLREAPRLVAEPTIDGLTKPTGEVSVSAKLESLALVNIGSLPSDEAKKQWMTVVSDTCQQLSDFCISAKDMIMLLIAGRKFADIGRAFPDAPTLPGDFQGIPPPIASETQNSASEPWNVTGATFETFQTDVSRELIFCNFVRNVFSLKFPASVLVSWVVRSKVLRGENERAMMYFSGRMGMPGGRPHFETALWRYLYQKLFPGDLPDGPENPNLRNLLNMTDEDATAMCLRAPPRRPPLFGFDEVIEKLPRLSLQHILLMCFNDYIIVPDDPGKIVNVLEAAQPDDREKAFMIAMNIAMRNEAALKLFDDFVAKDDPQWRDFLQDKVKMPFEWKENLQAAKQYNKHAIEAVVGYGKEIIPYLDSSSRYHRGIQFYLSGERSTFASIDGFCFLDLFRRWKNHEELDIETYKSIVNRTAVWLRKVLMGEVENNAARCDLAMSGFAEPLAPFVPVNSVTGSDIWDNPPMVTIVWLAGQLVKDPMCAESFLDFMTCAATSEEFLALFGSLIDIDVLARHSHMYLEKVIASGSEDVLTFLEINPWQNELARAVVRVATNQQVVLELGYRDWSLIAGLKDQALLSAFWDQFFRKPLNTIVRCCQSYLLENEEFQNAFYPGFALYAISKPAVATKIFVTMHAAKDCVNRIISAIPKGTKATPEFLDFLLTILVELPKSLYHMKSQPASVAVSECKWAEDTSCPTARTEEERSIWNDFSDPGPCTQLSTGHNYITQHIFHCVTCNLVVNLGCCLACAIKCHKGHDLFYDSRTDYYCDCYEKDECTFRQNSEQRAGTDTRPSERNRPTAAPPQYGHSNFGGFGGFGGFGAFGAGRHAPSGFNFSSRREGTPDGVPNGDTGFGTRGFNFGGLPHAAPRPVTIKSRTEMIAGRKVSHPVRADQDPITLALAHRIMSLARDDQDALFVCRLSKPVSELQLQGLPQLRESQPVHLESIQRQCVLSSYDSHGPAIFDSLAGIGGENRDILIVWDNPNIVTYRLPAFEQLSTFSMSGPDLGHVLVSRYNPNCFALVRANDVSTYRLDGDGKLHPLGQINDGGQAGLRTGFGMPVSRKPWDAEWVPLKENHIAVTSSPYVKIYNIPVDCLSPDACYEVSQGISSSCFFTHDGKIYLAIATQESLAIQEVKNEEQWPCKVTKFLNFPSFPNHATLTFCEESGLLFIGSGTAACVIVPVASLLTDSPITGVLKVSVKSSGASQNLGGFRFRCCVPANKAMHILRCARDPYVLEFTDSGFALGKVGSSGDCCGIFASDTTVYSITRDGKLHHLMPGKRGSSEVRYPDDVCDEEPPSELTNGFEFVVSPRLWTESRLLRDGVVVTSNKKENVSRLLRRDSWSASGKSTLSISLSNSGVAIVGIQMNVVCEGRPFTVIIKDRKYSSDSGRTFALPLKESEAKAGATVHLHLDGQGYIVQWLQVYVIAKEPSPDNKFDWLCDGKSLTDFVDVPLGRGSGSQWSEIAERLSAATFVCVGDDEEKRIVEEFIVMMYRTPSIAQFCRRMVLKTYGDNPELPQIWANAMRRAVREQTVHDDMRPILWRDYNVLPSEIRDTLTTELWNYSSPSGFQAVAAAFY